MESQNSYSDLLFNPTGSFRKLEDPTRNWRKATSVFSIERSLKSRGVQRGETRTRIYQAFKLAELSPRHLACAPVGDDKNEACTSKGARYYFYTCNP